MPNRQNKITKNRKEARDVLSDPRSVITLPLGRDKNNSGLLKELIRLQDLLLCPLTKKSNPQ